MADKKKRRAGKPAAAKKSKTASSKAKAGPKPAKPTKAKAAPAKARAAAKARRGAKPRQAPRRAARVNSSGFDIAKMLDHPLVADLLAVGAIAAVAAIAEHSVKTRTGEREPGSSKAIKAAGTAAAAAIGKRLMTEVDAIREVSKTKDAKRGPR